jgi:hypothetical protein
MCNLLNPLLHGIRGQIACSSARLLKRFCGYAIAQNVLDCLLLIALECLLIFVHA